MAINTVGRVQSAANEEQRASDVNEVTMDTFANFDFFPNDGLVPLPTVGGNDDFQMNNNYPPFDASMNHFAQEGPPPFLGPNDDLNSFFTPNRGITAFGNPNEPTVMPQGQWDNGNAMQMFSQQQAFPFPQQSPSALQQMPASSVQPTLIASNPSAETVEAKRVQEESSGSSEDQEKPKRGRPRNRKNKPPPSPEQERKKRERFLERNRAAASKCRKRKKESTLNIVEGAAKLERDGALLRRQLHEAKTIYAQYLGFAAEHAERCPNSSDMLAHLRSAAEKGFLPQRVQFGIDLNGMDVSDAMSLEHPDPTVGNLTEHIYHQAGSFPTMSRGNSQQSNSSGRSGYSTMHGLQSSNMEGMYTTDQLREESSNLERMDQVHSHSTSPALSQQFFGVDQGSALEMSRQHSFASQQSAAMSRQGSYSSTGQTSHKDSGYGSNRTTPKEQKPASPAHSINFESDPPMMSNQRVSSQQLQARQLRSGKAESTGLADLDDPSVHLERLARC